jgi:hypothetical protein
MTITTVEIAGSVGKWTCHWSWGMVERSAAV